MKKQLLYLIGIALVLVVGCAKEISFETGGSPSAGTLQDDATGDCLPKTVNGTYEAGKALITANNTIAVSVTVITTGSYTIYTDTVNGYYFRATGTFTTLGANTVTLRGNGTPFASGINNFVVSYGASVCDIQVTVLPAGAGGPAAYTLNGAPGGCSISSATGTYVVGTDLNGTNTVILDVTVTTIGTYNVTTAPAVDGMIFTGTGAFLATGPATITLTGSGKPTAAGVQSIPVTVGASTCNFPVTVVGPAVMSINCAGATVNGSYDGGTPLDASNTIDIPVNVTTAGAYSITTANVNGNVHFTGSGTLPLGPATITLTGSGTPVAGGTFNVVVTFGAASCNVPITFTAPPAIEWSFKEGATTYQGSTDFADLIASAPATAFGYAGSNATDDISIDLTDISGGINVNENYPTGTLTGNFGIFSFNAGSGETYDANPALTGVTLSFKITSHNTATKTITGTFSGIVKNSANVNKTITLGTFTATYP